MFMKRLVLLPLLLLSAFAHSRAQAPAVPTFTGYYKILSPSSADFANANPKPTFTPKMYIWIVGQNLIPGTVYPIVWNAIGKSGQTYSQPAAQMYANSATQTQEIGEIPLILQETAMSQVNVSIYTAMIGIGPTQVGQ